MAEYIRMPAVMANATDAVLSEWLIRPGERIAVGDPLAEIETDKAVVEYAAEVDGTIGRLLVEAGAKVMVGDPILVVLAEGEDAAAIPEGDPGGSAPAAAPAPAPAPAPAHAPAAAPAPAPAPTAPPTHETQPDAASERHGRRFATPIARRVAAQRGIDLARLTGTGPNGRIVRRDVEAHSASVSSSHAEALAGPAQGAPIAAGQRDVALTGMRRAIAQRLTESKSTIPHFYLTAHVRMDQLLALRRDMNDAAPRKISVNDLIVKAVAAAMVEVPAANAIWNGDSIRHFDSVDVAVAVAVPNGLLTPVVRGIERLSVSQLSAEIARLADAARSGRLQQHELEGGSFAVSNLGMYGVDEFTAIINPPQAGILAVAAAKPQAVVGEDGELAVANVMTVTLSADHRVIDGAVAAEWMAVLTSRLESPLTLLL